MSSRKVSSVMLIAAVVGLLVAVLGLGSVFGQQMPSATRSFSDTSVAQGGQLTVTIAAANYGVRGAIIETLPSGFGYVAGTAAAQTGGSVFVDDVDGPNVDFALAGEDITFTYTVEVESDTTPGDNYRFSGTLLDSQGMESPVGISIVAVEAGTNGSTSPDTTPAPSDPSATRSFSDTSVAQSGQLRVTIAAANYGARGAIIETSPPTDVTDGSCLETLLADRVSGEWSSSCESTDQVGRYARYYSFMLTEESNVTITLESSVDTYLYLRDGEAKSGTAAHENDDVAPGTDTNSEIEATLSVGTYTIEATTYNAGETGSFTLTVSGLGGGTTMPGPSDGSCLETLLADRVSGEWSSSCESTDQVGRYARYYSFMLTEESNVTITLESSVDTYLYLRDGEAKSGTAAHENDDVAPGTDTNSEIEATLSVGTYTIEATTYNAGETGSFTLTVSGLGGGTTMPGPSDGSCLETLLADRVSGEWSSSCESTDQVGRYARYYSFMLTEESNVTITLESSVDTYLYLRDGEAKSGTAAHENDDVAPGTDTNSEIEATLSVGTYTIEATTYSAGETGASP